MHQTCRVGFSPPPSSDSGHFIDDRVYAKRRKDRWNTIDHDERKSIVVDLARSADGAMVETPDPASREPADGRQAPLPGRGGQVASGDDPGMIEVREGN